MFGNEIKLKLEPKPTTRRVRIYKMSDDEITIRSGRGSWGDRMASVELFEDHLIIQTSKKPHSVEETIRVPGKDYETRTKLHSMDKRCAQVQIVIKYPEK